jgi:uncharacterized membrane protein
MNQNITLSQSLFKYAFGISLVVIGLDKVFHTNIVTEWEKYVSPLALSVLPISAVTLVSVLGVAEILVGILFFTRYCKLAAGIAILTLAAIIVNLFSLHMYDIALRDALIGLSAYVFILLTRTLETHRN